MINLLKSTSQYYLESNYEPEMHLLYLNLKAVNDLIYNEPTRKVSIFKDYLIFDDVNEFLKWPYSLAESRQRLPKLA